MNKSKTREEWVQHAIKAQIHPGNVARDPQRYVDFFNRAFARLQVLRAVKRGDLVKPSECSECGCGPLDRRKIQGHHPDYDKPLEVEWLCQDCHYDKHRGRYFLNLLGR